MGLIWPVNLIIILRKIERFRVSKETASSLAPVANVTNSKYNRFKHLSFQEVSQNTRTWPPAYTQCFQETSLSLKMENPFTNLMSEEGDFRVLALVGI